MLIDIVVERRNFLLRNTDKVLSVKDFANVYEKYGAKGMAYVSYMADIDNEMYCYLPEEFRRSEAMNATGLTKEQIKDPLFTSAIKSYKLRQLDNPFSKMKKGYDSIVNKLADYSISAGKGKAKAEEVDGLLKLLIDTPKAMKGREELFSIAEKENKKGRLRSERQTSLAEERFR